MRLGIGIDTGGTYTDAVMYDFDAKEVVLAVKALTTKEDLSLGIGNAIDGLPPDLVKRAELISLSTTLATNACVEDKGGRARLLFIGVDRRVVEWVGQEYGLPNPAEIFFLRGKTDSEGRVVEEPNWDALLKHCHKWMRGASAVGIVDIDAMDNSAILEKRAKQLVSEQCGVAAVCGHELFSDLNSVKRGSSVLLWNGAATKARDCIRIGKWSTFVRGLSVDTFGLGGDSARRRLRSSNSSLRPTASSAASQPAFLSR